MKVILCFLHFNSKGIIIIDHTIGSAMMTPMYCNDGTSRKAIATFPINSITLEIRGVLVSPNPCMLFRSMQIIAGNMNRAELMRRYFTALLMISVSWLAVIRKIRLPPNIHTIPSEMTHQIVAIRIEDRIPSRMRRGRFAPRF